MDTVVGSSYESKTYSKHSAMHAMKVKLSKVLNVIGDRGPTAAWIQYLRLCTLMKYSIRAERTRDLRLLLDSIREITPYFYAVANLNYAKSVRLYYQDMITLKEKIYSNNIKTSPLRARTRRSDISDSVIFRWIVGMICLQNVIQQMEVFTEVCSDITYCSGVAIIVLISRNLVIG